MCERPCHSVAKCTRVEKCRLVSPMYMFSVKTAVNFLRFVVSLIISRTFEKLYVTNSVFQCRLDSTGCKAMAAVAALSRVMQQQHRRTR